MLILILIGILGLQCKPVTFAKAPGPTFLSLFLLASRATDGSIGGEVRQ